MFRPLFCALLFLLGLGLPVRAGIARYSDHTKVDFDLFMQLLNPYGTWAQVDGLWCYTPRDHEAPYTDGRWLYTEYGWYWKGNLPHSWATEHYGFWKRGTDGVWAWYPLPFWLPEIVELRATSTHFGWRSGAVDGDGNYVEAPADRYAKTDEWSFVTKAQFTEPITPALIVKPSVAAQLLDDSSESTHTYMTYREIDRPGPHPADLLALAGNGGMFAPQIYLKPVPEPAKPRPTPVTIPVAATGNPAASGPAGPVAPSGLASVPAASTNAPPDEDGDEADPHADTRQVPYWVTMCLPSYWATRPEDARPNEIYIYRPDIYQDQDGIERRIGYWLNPSTANKAGVKLRDLLSKGAGKAVAPLAPGVPATDGGSGGSLHNAFQSPFDDSFHGQTGAAEAGKAPSNAAPSGLAPDGTAPSSAVTNAPGGAP